MRVPAAVRTAGLAAAVVTGGWGAEAVGAPMLGASMPSAGLWKKAEGKAHK